MTGLEIRYEIVKECICSIQQLPSHYAGITRPAVSGEGQGIAVIEQLADLYASFYGAMERLSEETAKYLTSMITEFRETDEKRAGK